MYRIYHQGAWVCQNGEMREHRTTIGHFLVILTQICHRYSKVSIGVKEIRLVWHRYHSEAQRELRVHRVGIKN